MGRCARLRDRAILSGFDPFGGAGFSMRSSGFPLFVIGASLVLLAMLGPDVLGQQDVPPADLQTLLARFEKERALPYAQRIRLVGQFSRFRTPEALQALLRLRQRETDRNMALQLFNQIARHEGPAVEALVDQTLRTSENFSEQLAAARAMKGKMNPTRTAIALEILVREPLNATLRRTIDDALGSIEDEGSIDRLVRSGLSSRNRTVLLSSIVALGRIGRPESISRLSRFTRNRDMELRGAAYDALGGIDDPAARQILERGLTSSEPQIASRCVAGLGRYAAEDAELREKMLRLLRSNKMELRLAAADALAEAGVREILEPLLCRRPRSASIHRPG